MMLDEVVVIVLVTLQPVRATNPPQATMPAVVSTNSFFIVNYQLSTVHTALADRSRL